MGDMTHAEIDALTGRTLDIAVARYVIFAGQHMPEHPGFWVSHYSDGTDMNATWGVVGEIKTHQWDLDISLYAPESQWTITIYERRFVALTGSLMLADAEGEVFAQTLCRAALHAVLDAQETNP